MIQRVRNVIKTYNKKAVREDDDAPQNKRKKIKTELLKRYPVTSFKSTLSDDAASIQSHLKTINEELKKTKPRDQLLLPLMKSTFTIRRDYVQNEANSVKDILEKYPALNRPAVVNIYTYKVLFTLLD